jgi:HEAT repeat protein
MSTITTQDGTEIYYKGYDRIWSVPTMSQYESRQAFVDANLLYGASKRSSVANKALARARRYLLKIREEEDRGEAFLLSLTQHQDEWVRLAAFQYLLPISEEFALEGLRALEKSLIPAVGLTASTTLSEWGKGHLRDYLMGSS